MGSERAWVRRLLTALGGVGAAGAMTAACDDSVEAEGSCDGAKPMAQSACFTRAELLESLDQGAGGAAGAGGSGAGGDSLEACPDENEILAYPIASARLGAANQLWSEGENGESCCYGYSYYCVGRPFVVEGELVVAPARERVDWASAPLTPASDLDEPTRQALARIWERDAALEHASVASFARFVLELLSVGAPAELVHDAGRALGDEIRHAELCYALASRYARKPIGPGPLRVPPFRARTLREVTIATLIEGCIAETFGVCEARERLAGAKDAAVVEALERIVEDEERHAELAFRFVGWALDQAPWLSRDIANILSAEIPGSSASDPGDGARALHLREHGVLVGASSRSRAELAFSRVLAPCQRALRAKMS